MNFFNFTKGRGHFLAALFIGLASGLFCLFALSRIGHGAGDFGFQLRAARDLLAGRDPYNYPPGPYNILYPLPAAMFAVIFAGLEDITAGSLFSAISGGLLAWLILRSGKPWRLLIFLSWAFFYSLLYAQWSPLIACLYFNPALLPLILMKPQIALPLALTQRLTWLSVGLTAAIGVLSLWIYPTWVFAWLKQISYYQGIKPPLFVLPFGPLVLLALLRPRERRTWVLLLMAVMPQRMLYDQLALLLLADNRREMLILVFCSWVSLPALLIYGGWSHLPGGWQVWILLTFYLPALGILLAPVLTGWAKQLR